LWLTSDAKALSTQAKSLFKNTDNPVFLSSVSVWEILVKHQLGKLPLPTPPKQFIIEQCNKHFIETLPLENDAIFHLAQLPNHHRDPFDRMLICQAIEHNLTLLTSDDLITQYPVKTAW